MTSANEHYMKNAWRSLFKNICTKLHLEPSFSSDNWFIIQRQLSPAAATNASSPINITYAPFSSTTAADTDASLSTSSTTSSDKKSSIGVPLAPPERKLKSSKPTAI